jgi:aspartate aminotransferase
MARTLSPTLAINEAVRARRARGEEVVHLGFGEAGLPVHPLLREALGEASGANAYGAVAGSPALREAVAGYFDRRGLSTAPDQILVGPGSKPLLYSLLLALDGDVVLPRPAWVSYEQQALLVRKRVVRVDIAEAAGGVPDPASLREEVTRARSGGADPHVLVLTHPDNPTGTFASRKLLAEVLGVARELGLAVVSDEIYAELAHAPDAYVSAARLDADVVVTGGLSKSHALGGWRVGVLRVPIGDSGSRLAREVASIASEIWSCPAAPIEHAAAVAYTEAPPLGEFVAAARTLHAAVATAAYHVVDECGLACRPPTAAFYLYPDFAPLQTGIPSSTELATQLLDRFGVAVLPGVAFGDADGLRVRMATSLLYGTSDEERWEALDAGPGAAELPRVVSSLGRLREALMGL